MSCKQRRKNELFVFMVTVYFYAFQVCHSVSLGQRGDALTAYQVQESNATRRERVQRDSHVRHGEWRLVETVIGGPNLRTSNQPGLQELGHESAAFPGEPLQFVSVPKVGETHGNLRTIGGLSRQPTSPASDPEDGHQADFTGFDGGLGKVLGPSFDSSPHFSEWLSMKPVLQCDDDVMTFTASGEGFANLQVDREGASPIPLLQLPSYCGYSVRTSWSDIEMMVPYDACYIIQENGSYVLPMLWWDRPLKLSCPMQMATPAPPFSPSVFCSPYGMVVQLDGQEQDILMLGVIVNGGWGPFVSEDCARYVDSNPGELTFFVSSSAPCVTSRDGLHVHFLLDDQEFILSCPVNLHFSHVPPPPPFPGDSQIPHFPDPVSSVPTSPPSASPPEPQMQEQIAQLPQSSYYPYPGFQYSQLPQVYPPGPQLTSPPPPTPGSPPGPQPEPQQQQQSLYPTGPDKLPYSSGDHPKYPSPPYQSPVVVQAPSFPNLSPVHNSSSHEVSKLSVGLPSGVYYPYEPFYYPTVTPAPTPAARKTTTTPPATPPPNPPVSPHYPQYYLQIPYYPAPTAAPVTQAPAPLPPSPPSPPPAPPKRPVDPQYPLGPFYLPASYSSYYHYGQFPHPQPGLQMQPASASRPTIAPPFPSSPTTTTTTTRTMVPKQPASPRYPFSQVYHQIPIYFPPPTPPTPAKEKSRSIPQEPLKPEAPLATCPPYTHTICGYYPYPYYPYYPYYYPLHPPHYHPPYPPVPQYPPAEPPVATKQPLTTTTDPTTTTTTPTTSSTASTPTGPTPQVPHLQCLKERMVVFLPFAHPDSIQVRDHMKTWLFLSTVSPLCGYTLQMAEHSGVILHSPVPACHSKPRTLTTISLPVRFWDLSMAQYRTLDLQCPYLATPETPAPVTLSVSPTPPSTAKGQVSPPVEPKPKVFCSSNQMAVELPSGSLTDIFVKDIKGNRVNLQDAPKHCGYSARNGKDGKIHLSLQLHSRCHMSVQGKMYIITVIYMTANGRREAQFFCPVLIPGSGQECNLPNEQRLPCGPDSVSQPQCRSMGCCFSKQPPACYYPMDECTVDRHFVFSVPASLTEPPLSPALLVSAGNSTCKPQRVTSDYALFKIPMDGCGTRRVMVGKTMIYLVEVVNKVQSISLNYGTITRDSPVRLLVECRYLPNTVLSVSYMVKTPSLGPAVQTQGVFGVQLRIAKDAQYSSYYPHYHQPLQMLLGKPLYLEVRLLSTPDPSLVLLVHFCVAYPRSGKAVWLLLYNGCPNPLDPAPQQAVLFDPQPPAPRAQTRRFTISTFQFLPDGEFKDPDEEIYFMCSTEICSPRDGPCVEGCFGQ